MIQIGSNRHNEYTWAEIIQEKIVQFHSQIIRTNSTSIDKLSIQLNDILQNIITSYNESTISKVYYIELLTMMYKMIGSTRDIIDGKGEYTLSYMMVYTWYIFFPDLSKYALLSFVRSEASIIHPYGSWKDIKYFCQYCKERNNNHLHPLIYYAIEITNQQLSEDLNKIYNYNYKQDCSLVAKWIPREKSKFGWLFKELAINYFSYYFVDNILTIKASSKAFTNYRKIISYLNNNIKTIQIKQCANEWSNINEKNITSITFHKQKYALLNKNKLGEQRSGSIDRILCADKINLYIQNNSINGKCILMNEFSKNAIDILNNSRLSGNNSLQEKIILNKQWNDMTHNIPLLGKIIPIIDTSLSMYGDALYSAISLGILISEKSSFRKRLLTIDISPSYINLDNCGSYVEMVEKVYDEIKVNGLNANFYATLDLLLETIIREKIPYHEVSNITLAILSDMQVDFMDLKFISLYDGIKKKYYEVGMQVYNKPLNPPHIIFWNLKSTNGFPVLSSQYNTSLLSGFSPSMLDLFMKNQYLPSNKYIINKWQMSTPFILLKKILSNKRYECLEKKLLSLLN